MIKNVSIKNFKSIKDLSFEAKKVNIFIGEPNSGKSNLLEALALFSEGVIGSSKFNNIIRSQNPSDLAYDRNIAEPIEVKLDNITCNLTCRPNKIRIELLGLPVMSPCIFEADYNNDHHVHFNASSYSSDFIKYYKFKPYNNLNAIQNSTYLFPPFGENLFLVLHTNKEIRNVVKTIYKASGFKFDFKPNESELLIAKEQDDEITSYSISATSDTLQRIVFYFTAIMSNSNSTLVFDEPEANTFPFYTKQIAEVIAYDETNQFFISTHNPYFLTSLIEKSGIENTAVFLTFMENYETKLKKIEQIGISEILHYNSDIFFNFSKLMNEEVEG